MGACFFFFLTKHLTVWHKCTTGRKKIVFSIKCNITPIIYDIFLFLLVLFRSLIISVQTNLIIREGLVHKLWSPGSPALVKSDIQSSYLWYLEHQEETVTVFCITFFNIRNDWFWHTETVIPLENVATLYQPVAIDDWSAAIGGYRLFSRDKRGRRCKGFPTTSRDGSNVKSCLWRIALNRSKGYG